jgi:hypothetical protein
MFTWEINAQLPKSISCALLRLRGAGLPQVLLGILSIGFSKTREVVGEKATGLYLLYSDI